MPTATPTATPTAATIKPKIDSEEAAAINHLIKKTAGGNDMNAVAVRRRSLRPSVEEGGQVLEGGAIQEHRRATMCILNQETVDELAEVNRLLQTASKGGNLKGALRQRRVSKEGNNRTGGTRNSESEEMISTEGEISPTASTVASEAPSRRPSTAAEENEVRPRADGVKQRWKDAALAAAVEAKISKLEGQEQLDAELVAEAVAATTKVFDVTKMTGTHHLTGAAARGTQAANLSHVREASAAVGGVFLTSSQHAALKEQINMLSAAKKRMNAELIELRQQLATERAQAKGSPPAGRASGDNSSPGWQRNLNKLLTRSPFGRRGNTESPGGSGSSGHHGSFFKGRRTNSFNGGSESSPSAVRPQMVEVDPNKHQAIW